MLLLVIFRSAFRSLFVLRRMVASPQENRVADLVDDVLDCGKRKVVVFSEFHHGRAAKPMIAEDVLIAFEPYIFADTEFNIRVLDIVRNAVKAHLRVLVRRIRRTRLPLDAVRLVRVLVITLIRGIVDFTVPCYVVRVSSG